MGRTAGLSGVGNPRPLSSASSAVSSRGSGFSGKGFGGQGQTYFEPVSEPVFIHKDSPLHYQLQL